MGLGAEQVMRISGTMRSEETGDIWPRNLRIVDRFLAVASQWRTAAGGLARAAILGLDYASCAVALDGLGLEMTPDDWRGLQAMEAAAAAAMNEARS